MYAKPGFTSHLSKKGTNPITVAEYYWSYKNISF